MVNKYKQEAEVEIDLHGYTTVESEDILRSLIRERKYKHLRIIVGKGTRSENGAVLPNFVRNYLQTNNIRYNQSKITDGGEGALEVFMWYNLVMIYIDVRTKGEYDSGHKDEATHHDIMDMMKGVFPSIDKNTEITLYCESGNRSMMAKSMMAKVGFINVIDGGGINNFL